jgi:hypothetical protein
MLNPITGLTLEQIYHHLCRAPSDINLLLPELTKLVDDFPESTDTGRFARVTEMGTRHGWSTVALLMGQPRWLKSYDIDPKPEDFKTIMDAWVNHCEDERSREDVQFLNGNTLEVEIDETDILFIDTLHTGQQLTLELDRHQWKVRHYIALHDVTSFGLTDEAPVRIQDKNYHPGLLPAVLEFLECHQEWSVYRYFFHNNGLLILKRRENIQNCSIPCEDCGAKLRYRGVWKSDEGEEIL